MSATTERRTAITLTPIAARSPVPTVTPAPAGSRSEMIMTSAGVTAR